MAYDESLADRIRRALADNDAVTERRMFGGLCFLAHGRMCCGIVGDMLMARINKAEYAQVLEQPHVRQMDFTGRPLSGFVYVEPEGIASARALRAWISRGLEVAAQSDGERKKRRTSGAAKAARMQATTSQTERKPAKHATAPRDAKPANRAIRQRAVVSTPRVARPQIAKPQAAKPPAVKSPVTEPQVAKPHVTGTATKTSAQPAGYSGTPLARKLGIVSGSTVSTFGAPAHYAELLAPLPDAVRFVKNAATATIVHVFTTRKLELAERLARLYSTIQPDAAVWVSWPKKASKVETDITEDVIRTLALPLGFVDIKVCAVDDVWSGLKLVIRVGNRATRR